jgi:hypothetical protein
VIVVALDVYAVMVLVCTVEPVVCVKLTGFSENVIPPVPVTPTFIVTTY